MEPYSYSSVAIVNDPCFVSHLTGFGHPETPKRVDSILHFLKKMGILTSANSISPRLAKEEEISLAHSLDYIHLVKRESASCQPNELKMLTTGDVVISSASFDVARHAVGAVLNGIDAVMTKRFSSAFCLVRPPGHHACHSIGMGFCLFNNIAIGALYALKTYSLKRVLIVDWDLHHGNGTEEIVKSNPSIFYFSTHQSHLWPYTGSSIEKGCGNILNIEIQGGTNSRETLIQAYTDTLPQAMESFQPELILISAGFDAHEQDPLGNLALKSEDFGILTCAVKQIADRFAQDRIVSVLEGGYNLEAIAESAYYHVKNL